MKAFIIRLKDNEISEKHASECVSEAKKYGIDVNYFDAINGNEYATHLENLKIVAKYKFKKGRVGVLGCFLSHFYLWKKCISENTPFLILEHDGFFIKPLPDDVMDHFTDVLKLDGLDPYSKSYPIALENQKTLPVTYEKYHNSQAKFLEKNQTGNYMRGAYSYIIKPNAAKKLIDRVYSHGFVPADQQIGDEVVDIQLIKPTIARLHPAYENRIKELSLTGNPELL
jgi:glycosyl transferase family 25